MNKRDERDKSDKREVAISIESPSHPFKNNVIPRSDSDEERDERAEQARAMRDEGMTLQQIADALGYKSASAVHYILAK